jgi:hypothetical protein
MIYYKNNTWNFHNFKVNFENRGNTEEKYTSDKDYWMNMENNNDNITNVAFQEFNPTETQLNRLEEINQQNVPEGFKPYLIRYINTGKLTKIEADEETGNEVELEVKSNMEFPMGKFKNYLENKQTNIDLSEREIREIEQGQELSELEIRILELEGGTA